MRDFGAPITAAARQELVDLIDKLYQAYPAKKEVSAGDFAMEENPERIVVKEIDLKWDGQRLRVGKTLDKARPPFEWIYEISSDMGESEYFKHYLVRENDIVLAQRKVLTVIDDEEAAILRADIAEALANQA
ncbi:MAG: hypothetical protein NVSMB39_4930 [Candidatus Saccharimonadales bacterium]